MYKPKRRGLKRKKSWLSLSLQPCLYLAAMILIGWVYTSVAQAITPLEEVKQELQVKLDTLWVVFAGCLVFFMNAGFAMLEAGFCRRKNTVNILIKNLIVFALSTIAFWFTGFTIMYKGGWQGVCLLEYQGFTDLIKEVNIPISAMFFFQLVFAGTAATIVSGAVAERIKFNAFIIFSFALVAIAYPITGRWIWGGGWLSKLDFYDFAGSTVVHSVGGWAALVGAGLLGSRLYDYRPANPRENQPEIKLYRLQRGKNSDGTKIERRGTFPGHNLSIATLGCLILWLGWFGFNPGSTLKADPDAITHIILTTNLAAAAGGLTATLISWRLAEKPDPAYIINGVLAGLVSITASCAFVNFFAAAIIGGLAGIFVFFSANLFEHVFKIDDPVSAISVHLVCGIWGTLAVGLFSVGPDIYSWYGNGRLVSPGPAAGLLFGGGIQQLMAQIIGVLVVGFCIALFSFVVLFFLKWIDNLRVSPPKEIEGLDSTLHGINAYEGFAEDNPKKPK